MDFVICVFVLCVWGGLMYVCLCVRVYVCVSVLMCACLRAAPGARGPSAAVRGPAGILGHDQAAGGQRGRQFCGD